MINSADLCLPNFIKGNKYDSLSSIPYVAEIEKELLDKINKKGIGPGGLGNTITDLAVHINTYPTHIEGLLVTVNICCHVNSHSVREI